MSDGVPNGNKFYEHAQRITALEVNVAGMKETLNKIEKSQERTESVLNTLCERFRAYKHPWVVLGTFMTACGAAGAGILKLLAFAGWARL